MSNHLARRGALVAVVALVAAIGFYFLFEREAPLPVALDKAAYDERAPEPSTPAVVELAAAPAPSTDIGAVPPDVDARAPDETRAAVGGALLGVTWGELIVAVDRGTREPIAGATIALVDGDGERREVKPADAVLDTDLAADMLVVFSAPTHVARVFFAHHLLDHDGPARQVRLHPAGSVSVSWAGGAGPLATPVAIRVSSSDLLRGGTEWGDEADEPSFRALASRTWAPVFAQHVRAIADPQSTASDRSRPLAWIAGKVAWHAALTPDGPPLVVDGHNVVFRGDEPWPRLAQGLPVGLGATVFLAFDQGQPERDLFDARSSGFQARAVGTEAWKSLEGGVHVVQPIRSSVTEIEVRHLSPSSVRGLLPLAAVSGRVRVAANEGGPIVALGTADVGADGAFHLTGLRPGAATVAVHWKTSDNGIGVVEIPLELEPGREHDLGRVVPRTDARTLTVSTKLTVDGAPASAEVLALLDGETLELDWMSHEHFDDPAAAVVSYEGVSARFGETVTITGLAPAQLMFGARIHGLAQRVGPQFHVERDGHFVTLDLTEAETTAEFVFELRRANPCAATFTIPIGLGRSKVGLEAYAFALDGSAHIEFKIKKDDMLPTSERHVRASTASLPRGEWIVVAVAVPQDHIFDDSRSVAAEDESFVAFRYVTVKDAPLDPLDLVLEPAACVRLVDAAIEPDDFMPNTRFHPAGLPSRIWQVARPIATTAGGAAFAFGLFPHTDYVDAEGKPLFRTGAGGTVTELDLR